MVAKDKSTVNNYFLYCRKSTDTEDMQVLSIAAQLSELRSFAKQEGLRIKETFIEKQSAKVLSRPIFFDMPARVEKGGAQKMNTSQSTFARILASANQKTADALINGKAIRIEQGNKH